MNRHSLRTAGLVAALLVLAGAMAPTTGHAGLGDRLKKKLEDKANKKADDAVDKAAGDAPAAAPSEADDPGARPGKPAGAGGGGKVSTVSTKFDFVPGDKVLLFDDFTQDELGEFPARWRLSQGTFEVVDKDGERWLRCTSVDGRIRMKATGDTPLPEFWTLEFDFDCEEPMGSAYTVFGYATNDQIMWTASYPEGHNLAFRSGSVFSSTPIDPASAIGGRHHMMLTGRGMGVKVYIDRDRVANVPEVWHETGPAVDLELRLWATTRPMITNVRYAAGPRPPKDLLAEGKFVTYGIRFATGSDVVLPESAPVLRQVATYMEANPAVKFAVTGHTDNVGTAATNLDLSRRRASSVAKVLVEQFAVAADRFTTDGKGDTQPVTANAKPEGRAMNRRVEFAKL